MKHAKNFIFYSAVLLASMGLNWLVEVKTSEAKTLVSIVHPSVSPPWIPEDNISSQDLKKLLVVFEQRIQDNEQDYEAWLLKGMVLFYQGNTDKALTVLNELTYRAPNFQLAHLIYGDVLMARSRPVVSPLGSDMHHSKELEEQAAGLRAEAHARLWAHTSRLDNADVPLQLLNMSHTTKTALLVDKSKNRLYIYERISANEPPLLIADYYVSTGQKSGSKVTEGDLKTPEGVYFIMSWIADDALPEKYGIGAFPTNYPNAFDRKFGRTGNGIWLHGTDPIYYSRPPLDSEGCVVLSNVDLSAVSEYIAPGVTPIVITESVEWVNKDEWHSARSQALKSIEKWRKDWESLDVNKYLSHYDEKFWNDRHTHSSWASYKKRIAKQKKYQKVNLSQLSVYYYPKGAADGDDVILATFRQEYSSNNYEGDVNKQIMLSKNSGEWKIVYEGR